MKLAIVIPYYKIAFLEECLNSLVAQTNKNFHVYIGNDSSPDDPGELINQYRSSLKLIYTGFSSNLGKTSLVKQWERCIDLVNDEEWILLMGDDDVLGKNCVRDFYNNLEEVNCRNINVFRYSSQVIDESGIAISSTYYHPVIENSIDFLYRRLAGLTRSSLSEYIFRKKQVAKIGFKEFPLAWHTDDLAILEFSNFQNIFSVTTSTVFFRNSGHNISSKNDNTIQKNLANFYFYHYLIKEHSKIFSEHQILILWDKMEKAFLDDKKHVGLAIKYSSLSFKNFKFIRFLDFSRRYLQAILK
ncbi:glycosyltransferase family 2 protein [Gillisia sp. M10.2A]|uniref:Glycosyltransferase family 2 protein n=1 Tax=Gillisia lutea TaxID=2909668 RepID=A0ABS9EJY5_9FLAO|nr:glycosyltransferase family 2 protein [Gillisia lutea]MCF4102120.1 glycosyltransferase family 2 protein [Gillisia lutea]